MHPNKFFRYLIGPIERDGDAPARCGPAQSRSATTKPNNEVRRGRVRIAYLPRKDSVKLSTNFAQFPGIGAAGAAASGRGLRYLTLVHSVRRSAAVVALLVGFGVWLPAGAAADTQPRFPIRAAFYYPWYPQTWTVGGKLPIFTPSLGYYRSDRGSVIRSHIRAMRRARLEAGIASWWGRNSFTDSVMPRLLYRAAATPFRWAVYYEREGSGDPSVAAIRSDLRYIKRRYGGKPGYLRVRGRFVVFVYADGGDGCRMAARWKRANTVNAYVVLKVFHGYRFCAARPNSWHQYAPAAAEDSQVPYSFSISPGFWKADEAQPRLARDLARWRANVRHMVAARAKWKLVTTFNEWGEGTAVESAKEWESPSGLGDFLDALRANGQDAARAAWAIQSPRASLVTTRYPRIVAAGDIACDPSSGSFHGGTGTSSSCRQLATSNLFVGKGFTAILALGDNQYERGERAAYEQSFAPSWGRAKALIRPAVGNHEYLTTGASGYFDYFGSAAGNPSKGYYSFNVGRWHLISLNSNCGEVGGCERGSPQERWLRADLAAHPRRCTLAYWHHPRFSSGEHGNDGDYLAFWRALYRARADVVLNGHDHDYERFGPQTPGGVRSSTLGIREFVVGTGGKSHYAFPSSPRRNSMVRNNTTYGVLTLRLRPRGYDWRFVPVAGKTFTDSGSRSCH